MTAFKLVLGFMLIAFYITGQNVYDLPKTYSNLEINELDNVDSAKVKQLVKAIERSDSLDVIKTKKVNLLNRTFKELLSSAKSKKVEIVYMPIDSFDEEKDSLVSNLFFSVIHDTIYVPAPPKERRKNFFSRLFD